MAPWCHLFVTCFPQTRHLQSAGLPSDTENISWYESPTGTLGIVPVNPNAFMHSSCLLFHRKLLATWPSLRKHSTLYYTFISLESTILSFTVLATMTIQPFITLTSYSYTLKHIYQFIIITYYWYTFFSIFYMSNSFY